MFAKYFIDPIKNHYLDFGGKSTRTQFWAFQAWSWVVGIVLGILIVGMYQVSEALAGLIALAGGLFSLAIFLPSLAIAARRLRDGGFTPWLLLLVFIPLGQIVLLVLFLLPSKN